MKLQVIQSARVNDAELSLIGVDTAGIPSISNFPRAFSKEGFALWKGLMETAWFRDLKKEQPSTSEVWLSVIQKFLSLCAKNGIVAFERTNAASNNEIIISFLQKSRRSVSEFFRKTEFFQHARIRTVYRNYLFQPSSFTVEAVAILRAPDPTFENWLKTPQLPGFKSVDGKLTRHIQANVNLDITQKLGDYVLTLKVFCHTPVRIPECTRIPSRAKLTGYAEKALWLPAVRSIRFPDTGNRLF